MKSSAIFIGLSLFFTSSVFGTSISRNGRCGKDHAGTVCPSSRTGPGSCCSSYGWCGRTDNHCLAERGCQSAFGSCIHPYVAPKQKISPDGSCGGKKGYTCQGSSFGDCCSEYGWCGRTPAYCASGCQNPFGICKKTATTSSCTKSSTSTRSPTHTKTQSSSISATTTPGLFTHLRASSSTSCTKYVKTVVSSSASSSTSCTASAKALASSSANTPSVSSLLQSSSTSSTSTPSGSMPNASSLVITPASSSNVVKSTSNDVSLSTSKLATSTSSQISITTSNPITPTSSDILSNIPEPVTPTLSESSVSTSDSATPTSSDTLSSTSSSDTIISTSSTSPTANSDISPSSSVSPTPTPTQAVVNPGFEDPSQAPWVLFPGGYQFVNTGDPQYGLKTPRVPRRQGLFASIRQVPTILPGTYLVEFSIKVEGPDPSQCYIQLTGIAENDYGRAANSDWNTYSYTLTSAGSNNEFIRIVVSCGQTPQSGYVYFDNITVKPIS